MYGCGESTRRLTGLMLLFPGLRVDFSSGETGRLDGRTISSTSLCGEFETKISGVRRYGIIKCEANQKSTFLLTQREQHYAPARFSRAKPFAA